MKSHRSRTLYRLRRGWLNEVIKIANVLEENNNKFLAARDNNFADYPTAADRACFIAEWRRWNKLLAHKINVYIKML